MEQKKPQPKKMPFQPKVLPKKMPVESVQPVKILPKKMPVDSHKVLPKKKPIEPKATDLEPRKVQMSMEPEQTVQELMEMKKRSMEPEKVPIPLLNPPQQATGPEFEDWCEKHAEMAKEGMQEWFAQPCQSELERRMKENYLWYQWKKLFTKDSTGLTLFSVGVKFYCATSLMELGSIGAIQLSQVVWSCCQPRSSSSGAASRHHPHL